MSENMDQLERAHLSRLEDARRTLRAHNSNGGPTSTVSTAKILYHFADQIERYKQQVHLIKVILQEKKEDWSVLNDILEQIGETIRTYQHKTALDISDIQKFRNEMKYLIDRGIITNASNNSPRDQYIVSTLSSLGNILEMMIPQERS